VIAVLLLKTLMFSPPPIAVGNNSDVLRKTLENFHDGLRVVKMGTATDYV
jgi:hypothetical protein